MTEKQIVEFNVTDAAIAKMENLYMGLTVNNVDDDQGFKEVDSARKIVKGHRTDVEKRRKELKADALAWGRTVDGKAKEIFAKLEPIEEHLKTQCRMVTDEKKRLEEAEAKAFQEKLDSRVNSLAAYNSPIPYQELATMSDDEFDEKMVEITKAWELEREKERIAKENRRIEAEEISARQKAEGDRLEKERLEFEEQQRVANIERDRLAAEYLAEQDRIAEEQQAALDKANAEIEAKQAKIDAKEAKLKAAEDAEKEKARVEQEEVDRVHREAEEAERAERLKPDKTKAIEWVESIRESLPSMPVVEDKLLRHLIVKELDEIKSVLDYLHKEIEDL